MTDIDSWLRAARGIAKIETETSLEVFQTLKCRWKPVRPAMVAGLTDHIWTVKELVTTVVIPNNT